MRIPNAGGFGGEISGPEQDPLAVVEHLAKQRDAGEITEAQFEAQKKRLLGGELLDRVRPRREDLRQARELAQGAARPQPAAQHRPPRVMPPSRDLDPVGPGGAQGHAAWSGCPVERGPSRRRC